MELEQLQHVAPNIHKDTQDKEKWTISCYKRGSHRLPPMRNGNYRIQEEKNKPLMSIESITPIQGDKDEV